MTPSEKDLRAALRQGEGDGVDADRVVAAGAAVRVQRRNRLVGMAAAVVLVAGVGSLTGVLVSGGGGNGTSADGAGRAESRDGAAIAPGEPTPGSARPSGTASATSRVQAAACPDIFPQRLLPGGPATGALFERPAASITVCSYGSLLASAGGARPAGLVLTGADAEVLQRSLENARSTPGGAACTAVRASNQRRLAFVPVDAAGRELRTVTTTLSVPICDTRTTNGVVVRYGWVPPLGVRQQLYALSPDGSASSLPARVPSGKNIGTPVR